jgi:hypothetical protein
MNKLRKLQMQKFKMRSKFGQWRQNALKIWPMTTKKHRNSFLLKDDNIPQLQTIFLTNESAPQK